MLLSDEATNQSETHCGLQNREDTHGFCLLHMRENANEVTHSFGDCPFLHLNQTFVANRQEKHGLNMDTSILCVTCTIFVQKTRYQGREAIENFYREFLVVFIFSTLFLLFYRN